MAHTTIQEQNQTVGQATKIIHSSQGVEYYFGPRASEIDARCDPDNPFLNRERMRVFRTKFGKVTAALDMPLFVFVISAKGEKRVQLPLRVKTPRGKGTIWQSWTDRMGVQLDQNLAQVVYFTGEQLEQIEPLYERIYEQAFFIQWLKSI